MGTPRRERVLRVGFDGRALGSPAAGVRRYARELLKALAGLGEPIDLVALGGSRHLVPAGIGHAGEPWHPPTNLGWALVGLPRAARQAGAHVLHAPAYTGPLWGSVPVVLTIHDVSYERHPEWYPYRRDAARRAFYRASAKRAAAVITDSAFSASEIQAAYGIPDRRMTVVPLGVDPVFAPGSAGMPDVLPAGVREPFVLHVGDLHERRNLTVVVDAVLEARRRFGATTALSLVLAGIDRGVGDALCAIAARAGAPDAVVKLGPVEERALPGLYRAAAALVYPSRYEGFGLPLLEAMACGTPVIASRAASIPEVVGDAGVLLDPADTGPWTEAIVRVVNDEGTKSALRRQGLARAEAFTWGRTARQTLDVYRRVST